MDIITRFAQEMRDQTDWALYAARCGRCGAISSGQQLLDVAITAEQRHCRSEVMIPNDLAQTLSPFLERAGYRIEPNLQVATRILRGPRDIDGEFLWLEHLDWQSAGSMGPTRRKRRADTPLSDKAWMDAVTRISAPRRGWNYRFVGASKRVPLRTMELTEDWEAYLSCGAVVEGESARVDLIVQVYTQRGGNCDARDLRLLRKRVREQLLASGYSPIRIREGVNSAGPRLMYQKSTSSLQSARRERGALDRIFSEM